MLKTYFQENISEHLSLYKEDFQLHWEATRTFCEGLDPTKSMARILAFLKKYMDAQYLMISFLQEESYNSICFVVGEGFSYKVMETKVFIPHEHKSKVFSIPGFYAQLSDSNENIPMTEQLLEVLPKNKYSFLTFRIMLNSSTLATFNIAHKAQHIFSEKNIAFLFAIRHPIQLFFENLLEHYTTIQKNKILTKTNKLLQKRAREKFISLSSLPGLKNVAQQVYQVAPLACPVLILGETGVGKELIADELYDFSQRSMAPYIKMNCGAMPEQLVDTELFGHEKGAFSGAVSKKIGRFERADKGTLFLDEIGELPLNIQARLLRVLQSGEFDPVGATATRYVDVRIIAATHADLFSRAKSGAFREDLFYRLNVFPITIPPLRERKEDIPILVEYFLTRLSEKMCIKKPILPAQQMDKILSYAWPGNVRQLQNTIEQSLIMQMSDQKDFISIRLPNQAIKKQENTLCQNVDNYFLTLDEVIIQHISAALLAAKGRINGKNGAAQLLGMNPCTLRSKMKKHKIPFGVNASKYANPDNAS